MEHVGATMEEMNSIRYGPPYKGKTACAVACILEKAGVMSNKKYSKKGFLTAVTPFILADPKKMGKMREIANNCEKEVANSEDECEAADHVIQCLRKNIPQITDFEF
ncbi:uncharacterized protein LOC143913163 [Arctopsyche grandis]|uniref:uncharacterized protein LOC143913163 n=1 Tax=Arctopsyche grandis TaxID=121162 RepID=UPI00406D7B04